MTEPREKRVKSRTHGLLRPTEVGRAYAKRSPEIERMVVAALVLGFFNPQSLGVAGRRDRRSAQRGQSITQTDNGQSECSATYRPLKWRKKALMLEGKALAWGKSAPPLGWGIQHEGGDQLSPGAVVRPMRGP